mmetsp:Transcript_28921/g.82214  ORF Transcript_28921/g.82214 Transcript_28921/m.82214 type:complete len:308 (+) Transcript_28921:191-1114(+)
MSQTVQVDALERLPGVGDKLAVPVHAVVLPLADVAVPGRVVEGPGAVLGAIHPLPLVAIAGVVVEGALAVPLSIHGLAGVSASCLVMCAALRRRVLRLLVGQRVAPGVSAEVLEPLEEGPAALAAQRLQRAEVQLDLADVAADAQAHEDVRVAAEGRPREAVLDALDDEVLAGPGDADLPQRRHPVEGLSPEALQHAQHELYLLASVGDNLRAVDVRASAVVVYRALGREQHRRLVLQARRPLDAPLHDLAGIQARLLREAGAKKVQQLEPRQAGGVAEPHGECLVGLDAQLLELLRKPWRPQLLEV